MTFLVGVSKGTEWGWREPRTIGVIATGLVLLLLWAAFEVRHPQPLVDLRTTARRPVLLTNLAAVLIGFAMMAQLIVVPQLLQLPEAVGFGMGLSILEAGLWMAPSGLMMLVFAPVSSRLLTSFGGRVTLALGAAVMACGYTVAVFLTRAPWQMTITTCVIAAGVGIGYAAMPSLILEHVPEAEAGSSVGVNALMRSIGTTLAGAVMAAVLASDTLRPAAGMPELPTPGAFRWCLLIGAWTAVLGAVTVLMIARRPRADGAGRPVLVP